MVAGQVVLLAVVVGELRMHRAHPWACPLLEVEVLPSVAGVVVAGWDWQVG